MSEQPHHSPDSLSMPKVIESKQQRRLAARRQPERNIWFGLGMFGLIGWSIAIPTLIGIATGLWIDHHWPSDYSWTLMIMLVGVGLGCLNAWRWLHRESAPDETRGKS